ncbi:MAG: hypothetical protein OXG62_15145, partial [Nitrospinae bacterium]|nr:hypothetical protein [Nitrospinota bacterium]
PGEQDFRRVRKERESEGGIGPTKPRADLPHHSRSRLAVPLAPLLEVRHSGVNRDGGLVVEKALMNEGSARPTREEELLPP